MEYKTAQSKIQLLSGRLHFVLLVSVGLLIANICLVWLVGWSFVHQKRTVIPLMVTQSFTVSDYAVDNSYLRQMALFFVAERLDLAPSNIKQAHTTLLQYTDPEFYHDFVGILGQEEKEVMKQDISSVFYPNEVITNAHNLTVVVKGSLSRWVGSLSLEPVKKIYLLKFTYKAGSLKISSFSEIAVTNNA